MRRTLVCAALLGVATIVHAARPAPPAVQQREPTADERNAFDEYYREQVPPRVSGGPSLFAPVFDIQRRRGQPWQVIARVDSSPRHYTPELCRQVRTSYIYDAKAPKGQRWSPSAAAPEWYVWLATPKVICTAAQYTVRMDPAVSNEDATALLRQHRELLQRARLLFAGNSGCARQRSLTFRFAAMAPAPPANGAPAMVGMVFESDRDTRVHVAVRKHRGEYAAWNVNCAEGAAG
ncbi:hypothetical protein SAMN05192549_101117 [Duganella sacchari]|uniref:Uncharacterized protein n=1 Tax=Duganella sacchari TaxID=551987 RepID=A0A1M7HB86_9BURK|nr:hypothetical protein [Duganella sacchari]SHM25705.1 hypothetical protein SAMN05192549_101117 [Duganella sacchari]